MNVAAVVIAALAVPLLWWWGHPRTRTIDVELERAETTENGRRLRSD